MIIEYWKSVGIQVQGKYHIEKNIVCQDKTFELSKNGVRVIALADGAGSQDNSQHGASEAVKSVSELIADNFYDFAERLEKKGVHEYLYKQNLSEIKRNIITAVTNKLNTYAITHNVSVDSLACTLMFAAKKDDIYIIGSIGDGVMGAINDADWDKNVEVLFEPRNGAQPNLTFFVTDPDAEDHLRLSVLKDSKIDGIIMMSDGPAEFYYSKGYGFESKTQLLFEKFDKVLPQNYAKMLEKAFSDRLSQFTDDDLSINLLYRETVDFKKDTAYAIELLSQVKYKSELKKTSNYTWEINTEDKKNTSNDFKNLDEVMSYIK